MGFVWTFGCSSNLDIIIDNWKKLKKERKDKTLKPNRRLVPLGSVPGLPNWARDGYIYAFPNEKAPRSWQDYEYGGREWDILQVGIRIFSYDNIYNGS